MLDIPFYLERGYVSIVLVLATMAAVFATAITLAMSDKRKVPAAAVILLILIEVVTGFTLGAAHEKWYDKQRCTQKVESATSDSERRIYQSVYCRL